MDIMDKLFQQLGIIGYVFFGRGLAMLQKNYRVMIYKKYFHPQNFLNFNLTCGTNIRGSSLCKLR